ncbi:MAG: hypothetical protein KKF48_05170 [Nanoarchaeota archaeon]|nr:hypothetical protein [Nanoarchaeota archaeon]MBU1028409.1 hypothetical protein [Nanoarchaeota archaeon]
MKRINVDLHNHLGRMGRFPSFDRVVDVAFNRLGIEGVFSVANCEDYRYEDFVNSSPESYDRVEVRDEKDSVGIYVPQKKILIVKGQEVFTPEGHVLVIGLPKGKNIKSKTLDDSFSEAKDYNAVTIVDHPFYKGGAGPKILDFEPDGWEVYNASAEFWFPKLLPIGANEKSAKFYNEEIRDNHDTGACSFTDGHSPNVIGKSYTMLPLLDKQTPQALINSLRQGIKGVKSFDYLHREPNRTDAFIHAAFMTKDQIMRRLLNK